MKIPGEYIGVSRRLWQLDVGDLATAAHTMPITPTEAQDLIRQLCGPLPVTFRGYRGRAYRPRGLRQSRITIPSAAGVGPDGVPHLRLGIVFHECAHILTYREWPGASPHGERFCQTLARLLREF